MQKQLEQTQDGFVSFMLEKDDSYILNPNDHILKIINDEDYQKQLSRQFYGQRSEVKKPSKIDPLMLKQKIVSRALIANSERGKQGVSAPTVSEQLQQIYKLLSSSKPKMQSSIKSSFKNSIHSSQNLNKIKNPHLQSQQLKLSIPIPIKKTNIHEPRTYRLRIEDSNGDQFNQVTQNSYRSTLNSSTKSTAKPEKPSNEQINPKKRQIDMAEDNKATLFKISYRNKIQ